LVKAKEFALAIFWLYQVNCGDDGPSDVSEPTPFHVGSVGVPDLPDMITDSTELLDVPMIVEPPYDCVGCGGAKPAKGKCHT
jgi:hypothetical protein